MMALLFVQALYVGNAVCATCHTDIAKAYRETPMAKSSGVVTGGLVPGSFLHQASGTNYRIDTSGTVTIKTTAQSVERRLNYFIGSGAAGQSFLYTRNGFLFQAPITWYSQPGRWDASPGYEEDKISRWSRPVAADCLNCHSSQVRAATGFENRYADPPFAQAGIGCERCHGPGSEHVQGRGRLVNPAKLDAARRDSICAQCHLSGEARITRVGMRLQDYRPGALLSAYAAYFVSGEAPALKATSYVEKLAVSRCKIASGDRLWCATCHDPHRVPSSAERISWFQAKCLGCHQQSQCQRGTDCTSCHMPRGKAVGGGHGVLTDHSIPRRPGQAITHSQDTWTLQPFSRADSGLRELGLAYAETAARTDDPRQVREALRLLPHVEQDSQVELWLADLYQRSGNATRATSLFYSVLRDDPTSVVALVNVANAQASQGDLTGAISLWREALRLQPCQTEAALNLQTAYKVRKETQELRALLQTQEGCIVE